MKSPRVLFYCHNTYGLGHTVRSLRIAGAVAALGGHCALLTGCRHVVDLTVPSGIELSQLAPACLDPAGRPIPWPGDPDHTDIVARRSSQILRFCKLWAPDCLLTDLHPLGLGGELVTTLLDPDFSSMQAIWGLPYPEGIGFRAYRNPRLARAYHRYELILAYSDPLFDDVLSEQDHGILSSVAEYVGFVTAKPAVTNPATHKRTIVVLCGGGYGGLDFYSIVLNATSAWADLPLRIVVGPLGEAAPIYELCAGRNVEILKTASEEEAIRDAAIVISRAGYNTSFYLVQTALPLVFVPQHMGNDDQPRRAAKLARYINVWNVPEAAPKVIERLQVAIEGALLATPGPRSLNLKMEGATRSAERILKVSSDRME